jgi:ferredoxin-NADP reductase
VILFAKEISRMEAKVVLVKAVHMLNHDVIHIVTEKPPGFEFNPGQAADIAINKPGWREEKRPFTFTNLPSDNHLEFTIKTYPERKGVTKELLNLKQDESLLVHEVFGTIAYKGKGVFIAGGAGITPFLSILRDLKAKEKIGGNKLIYSNKTEADILLKQELYELLGENFLNILTEEKTDKYSNGKITAEYIKSHIPDLNTNFYICGPEAMQDCVIELLKNEGVKDEQIIKEES